MLSNENLTQLAQERCEAVETRLKALIPAADSPPVELARSMRHTLLAPGKRVRALLAMFAADHLDGDECLALSTACAIEMVHAASLILDDLPAMDDALLRRGRPTNHQIYGEPTAMLAAIALLSRAFGIISEDEDLSAEKRVRLSAILSRSVGSEGLVAGQEQDLRWRPEVATRENVALVHARKTAALFSAAAEMGALAVSEDEQQIALMRDFGLKLGLAFQILDDLLDATSDEASAGKDVAQDEGRPSLVRLIGLSGARREADRLVEEALILIAKSRSDETLLRHFAMWLIARFESKLNTSNAMTGGRRAV